MIYSRLYDSVLTRIDPERAHGLALGALSLAQKIPGGLAPLRALAYHDPQLGVNVWGQQFENPIGVAAGLDKDGHAIDALTALGFGHLEVGTVTPRPQPGNPKPRMWRLPAHRAAVNAMGFPSRGADAMSQQLARPRCTAARLGLNIGKNRDTALDAAGDDYAMLAGKFSTVADFLTINVSSPNTPGLRQLQDAGALRRILEAVIDACSSASRDHAPPPVLVKVSPDADNRQLLDIADVAAEHGAAGLVATNTTTSREGLGETARELPGGLSGAPLRQRANEVVRLLYQHTEGKLPIIGVGGVATAADVVERMRSGATLVQLYTSFIYGGPSLPGKILRELSAIVQKRGWRSIDEIIGSG